MEDLKQQWQNLMLRLKEEAERATRAELSSNRQRGVAIVTMHVLMDHKGTPLLWVVPQAKRIEPSNKAVEVIQGLMKGFNE